MALPTEVNICLSDYLGLAYLQKNGSLYLFVSIPSSDTRTHHSPTSTPTPPSTVALLSSWQDCFSDNGFFEVFWGLPFCSDAQDSACMLLRAFNVISTKCSESVATALNVHDVRIAVRAAWCFGRWIFHSCAVSNPSLYIRYNVDLISQLISQLIVRGPMSLASSVLNYFSFFNIYFLLVLVLL